MHCTDIACCLLLIHPNNRKVYKDTPGQGYSTNMAHQMPAIRPVQICALLTAAQVDVTTHSFSHVTTQAYTPQLITPSLCPTQKNACATWCQLQNCCPTSTTASMTTPPTAVAAAALIAAARLQTQSVLLLHPTADPGMPAVIHPNSRLFELLQLSQQAASLLPLQHNGTTPADAAVCTSCCCSCQCFHSSCSCCVAHASCCCVSTRPLLRLLLPPCRTSAPLHPRPGWAAQWWLPQAHRHRLWAHPGWTGASPAQHGTGQVRSARCSTGHRPLTRNVNYQVVGPTAASF